MKFLHFFLKWKRYVCFAFLQVSVVVFGAPNPEPTNCSSDDSLLIEYLGTSGYLVTSEHDALLLDPFFSHQSYLRALSLRRLKVDEETIEQYLPSEADKAVAILVGHSHYDHLLDVPYIAENRATLATIYGSKTTKNLLGARPKLKERLVSLNERVYEPGRKPQWIKVTPTLRFMPIASDHAPQLPGGIKIMKGKVKKKQEKLPTYARGWKEGLTIAYLIEFLDENRTVEFRVHFLDSASSYPHGFPPQETGKVDVLILSLASHQRAIDYPQKLLETLKPRNVIVGHWESFFRPYSQVSREVKGIKFSKRKSFLEKLAAGKVAPERINKFIPGEKLRLCRDRSLASSKHRYKLTFTIIGYSSGAPVLGFAGSRHHPAIVDM